MHAHAYALMPPYTHPLCCKGTEVCVCMKDAQIVQVDFFFLTASKSPRRVHSLEGGAGNRWVVV